MSSLRYLFVVAAVAFVCAPLANAQEFPKPGAEHDTLKALVGVWDASIKSPAGDAKGVMTYTMEMGGLWLCGAFEGEFGGQKFTGRGLDSYDAAKKKYVGYWFDSMSTSPVVFEGGYDKDKKTLTMTGDGPGPDGKPMKYKSVTEFKDADNVVFHMYMGDGKDAMMTITYKRKK